MLGPQHEHNLRTNLVVQESLAKERTTKRAISRSSRHVVDATGIEQQRERYDGGIAPERKHSLEGVNNSFWSKLFPSDLWLCFLRSIHSRRRCLRSGGLALSPEHLRDMVNVMDAQGDGLIPTAPVVEFLKKEAGVISRGKAKGQRNFVEDKVLNQ